MAYGQTKKNLYQQNPNQAANGAAGTNRSIKNAAVQSAGKTGSGANDPFRSMVDHAIAFNSATAPMAYSPSGWTTTAAEGYKAPGGRLGARTSNVLGDPTHPGDSTEGETPITPPVTPPVTPPGTPPVTPPAAPTDTFGVGGDINPVITPPPTNSPLVPASPIALNPPPAERTYDEDVERYASNPGYEWLRQPEYRGMIAEFRNAAIGGGWNTTDPDAPGFIDVVDWLASMVPGQPHPLQGRAGWDTFSYNKDFSPKLGPNNLPTYGGQTPAGTPWSFGPNHEALGQDGRPLLDEKGNVRYADGYGPTGVIEGYGTKPFTPATPTPPTPPGGPAPTTPPGGPAPGQKAFMPPADPYLPPSGVVPPGGTGEDIVKQLYGLLNPTFDQAQKDYLRAANAQNALVGGGDAGASGGYATATNRGLADLVGQQSGQVADIAAKASEAEKDRGLTREGLAMQKGIADMNADIDRLKITTEDQLQRWLNDPKNDTIQKYGIDKNEILQRYQATLGAQMTGNANINKSAFNTALGGMLAQTNAQALQLQRDQMRNQYNLGVGGLDVQREGNLMNFLLGQGGLGNEAIRALMQSLGLTPPGTTVVKP